MIFPRGGPAGARLPAWAAGLASALLPGAGQALAGEVWRGLLLLAGFAAAAGLLAWRFAAAVPGSAGLGDTLARSARSQPGLLALALLLLAGYLWIIFDAYQAARGAARLRTGPALLLLLVWFGLGWQVGQVNPRGLVDGLRRSAPALGQLLWPWPRAVTVPLEQRVIGTLVSMPCGDPPTASATARKGRVALHIEPACGRPSDLTGEQGTVFTLRGSGFDPAQLVEIWWRDPQGSEFPQRETGGVLVLAPDGEGAFQAHIIMPFWLQPPSDGEDEQPRAWQVQARQQGARGQPVPSRELRLALARTAETLLMALVATGLGLLLALPLGLLAAAGPLARPARAAAAVVRAVPALIWVVVAVMVVGLGPFAGILALALYTASAMAQALPQALPPAQAEGGWPWRAALPALAALLLARWDANLRLAAVVGLVGGGGIGVLLAQWLRLQDYAAAGIAIWLAVLTVALSEALSAAARRRYLSG